MHYLANFNFEEKFQLGAGVNFFRLVPNDKKLSTKPYRYEIESQASIGCNTSHPFERANIYVSGATRVDLDDSNPADSLLINNPDFAKSKEITVCYDDETSAPYHIVGGDTTFLSHRGTKVIFNFAWDIQKTFFQDNELLGENDLKLYGELGIIGLNTSEAYNTLYGKITQRMPVMVGLNIPALGFLDHLSLEVEYYGSPFRNDTRRLQPSNSVVQSVLPVSNKDLQRTPTEITDSAGTRLVYIANQDTIPFSDVDVQKNITSDNIKWSLHGAKTIQDHFVVSFQIASDHFRPYGTATSPTYETAFTRFWDCYWMAKIAYFF